MEAIYYTGCRYITVFVDEHTRIRFPVFCKDRTALTLREGFKVYCAFMKGLGVTVCALDSDQGPEYVSKLMMDFCDDHAVRRLLSVRYCPEQDGMSEAVFGVYIPRVRCALAAAGLPKRAYALGMAYALWTANRTYSRGLGGTPMSRLPEPPIDDLHHGHVLGSRVYAHQPKVDVDDKMSPTARAGIFMGVSDLYKGVIVAYPETSPWQFEHSFHCTYDEA